jgi:hypothetical protein
MNAQFAHWATVRIDTAPTTEQMVLHSQLGTSWGQLAPSSLERHRGEHQMGDELQETIIEMEVPLSTLRLMHICASRTLDAWPGGDPWEQEHLMELKRDLYVILMSALYDTDQI